MASASAVNASGESTSGRLTTAASSARSDGNTSRLLPLLVALPAVGGGFVPQLRRLPAFSRDRPCGAVILADVPLRPEQRGRAPPRCPAPAAHPSTPPSGRP